MITAADRLRALAASPTELLGPPEGVEYAVTLNPAVVLAIADLIDAGETPGDTHRKWCSQDDSYCCCWLCGEDWPCPTAKALAHLEELLP